MGAIAANRRVKIEALRYFIKQADVLTATEHWEH